MESYLEVRHHIEAPAYAAERPGAAVACAVAACAAAVGTLVEVVAAYDWTERLPSITPFLAASAFHNTAAMFLH